MKKQTYILLAIILIVVVAIYIFSTSQHKLTPISGTTGPVQGTGMMVEDNSIAVSAQGETNTLTASMVVLTNPGYVVVHEDKSGQPGKVIGVSKLVGAGMAHDVTVQLSRKAVQGEKLYAMLHNDNGDGVYTNSDQPVVSKSGEPLMMIITVEGGNISAPGAVSI